MKCVRVVGQGIPVRLSDADARRLVEVDGDGEYCPKAVWRNHYRCHGTPPLRIRLLPDGRAEALTEN